MCRKFLGNFIMEEKFRKELQSNLKMRPGVLWNGGGNFD